jgi:hypothetical protein
MQTYSDSQKMFVSGKALALWTVILLGAEAMPKLADISSGFRFQVSGFG